MGRLALQLFELGVLGVAAACGVAAVAAQGGRWNDRLDLLTHFAPVWLAGGIVALLAAIWFRPSWRKVTAMGFALAAVASAGALMWGDLVRLLDRPEPAPEIFKIAELNAGIWRADPRRVARWLMDENPDVAIVLEAPKALEDEVVAATGMYPYHGSGALIFTRQKPLRTWAAWDVRALPGAPTELTWVELLDPEGRPFAVMGVHAGWPIPARYAWGQDQKLTSVLHTLDPATTILAGDFNSTQWSFRQRIADAAFGLERRDVATPTWPARLPIAGDLAFPLPFLSIDHVYAGRAWRTVGVKRGPWVGSDHYPLVATFAWR